MALSLYLVPDWLKFHPHFIRPIREQVTGMTPDEQQHGFSMQLVPELGVAVQLQIAMQINVILHRDPQIFVTQNMTSDLVYYPMIYFIAKAEITDDAMLARMRLVQKVPAILIGCSVALIAIGITLTTACAIKYRNQRLIAITDQR